MDKYERITDMEVMIRTLKRDAEDKVDDKELGVGD